MISCDITPLAHAVLSDSLGVTDTTENIKLNISAKVFNKIDKRSSSGLGLEGYLGKKAEEFVQIGFAKESLEYATQKNVSTKMSFFLNDIMNGADAWLSIGNSHRVSVDVTSIYNIHAKEHTSNKYTAWKARWQKHGKGQSGILDDTFGRIVIGIPNELESLSKRIVYQAQSIDEAQVLIRIFFWRYKEIMDEIMFVGMNKKGKNWVSNLGN